MSLGSSPSSIVATIGNTPLVKLTRFAKYYDLPKDCSILAKLECCNPGGSKKDRVALQLVLDAHKSGFLKHGQPIVELTSGNTGTGLAIVSKAFGHSFTAVMSKGNTPERAQQMKAFGANIILVDQHPSSRVGQVSGADLELVARATDAFVEKSGAFRADQFCLASSWRAHYLHTAPECWRQILYSSNDKIDTFVDFVGTGGTFIGVSKYLKEQNPSIKCMIVEPSNALILNADRAREPDSHVGHKIQGGGYSKRFDQLPLFTSSGVSAEELVDGYLDVTDEDAIQAARLLASEEGIFCGYSSGANAIAAVQTVRKGIGQNVLFCVCDTGLKYLSTDLYE